MTAIAEARRIDGQLAYRLANSSIDAMLVCVQRELGIRRMELLGAINIDCAALSRCRNGDFLPQENWLLRMHLFSAIPVDGLMMAGGIQHEISPHIRARRPQ